MARTSKFEIETKCIKNKKLWQAGLYKRLSKEDGDNVDSESDSIISQELILQDYCAEHPEIEIIDTYTDDGYSGTNFERPEFIRLLEDIRGKKINCVIVKDLSRFGRNYVEAGQYLETFFPIMNIRFIAVNDDIDSYLYPNSINNVSMVFKNVLNEEYCRDISIKIRSVLNMKRQNGEFIGAFPSYGYKKDPQNHNKLIIDNKAALNVKTIYKLYLEGKNISRISIILNDLGIPNPSKYKKLHNQNYKSPFVKFNDGLWSSSSVRIILTNRIYTGDMVQATREKISHKIKKIKSNTQDKWIIVENTHEAIIDKETFNKVQELLKRDTRISPNNGELGLFAGFIKCADCKRAMVKKKSSQTTKNHFFVCRTYNSMSKKCCTRHCIRSDKLEATVLKVISKYIDIAVEMEQIIEYINQLPQTNFHSLRTSQAIEINKKEKLKIENIMLDLYPDWKNNLITKEQYINLKNKYEVKLEKIKLNLQNLELNAERVKSFKTQYNKFINNLLKFKNIKELTRDVIVGLINNIYVHEGGGITIDFKFKDEYEDILEYFEGNKNSIFMSNNLIQKYGNEIRYESRKSK